MINRISTYVANLKACCSSTRPRQSSQTPNRNRNSGVLYPFITTPLLYRFLKVFAVTFVGPIHVHRAEIDPLLGAREEYRHYSKKLAHHRRDACVLEWSTDGWASTRESESSTREGCDILGSSRGQPLPRNHLFPPRAHTRNIFQINPRRGYGK